jgi:hypothetical protein
MIIMMHGMGMGHGAGMEGCGIPTHDAAQRSGG